MSCIRRAITSLTSSAVSFQLYWLVVVVYLAIKLLSSCAQPRCVRCHRYGIVWYLQLPTSYVPQSLIVRWPIRLRYRWRACPIVLTQFYNVNPKVYRIFFVATPVALYTVRLPGPPWQFLPNKLINITALL